jgi:hypothetical protein
LPRNGKYGANPRFPGSTISAGCPVALPIKRVGFPLPDGKPHSSYFCFGEYDAVLIAEAPNNVTAAPLAFVTASGGALSKFRTSALTTGAEAMEAPKLATKVAYPPPK